MQHCPLLAEIINNLFTLQPKCPSLQWESEDLQNFQLICVYFTLVLNSPPRFVSHLLPSCKNYCYCLCSAAIYWVRTVDGSRLLPMEMSFFIKLNPEELVSQRHEMRNPDLPNNVLIIAMLLQMLLKLNSEMQSERSYSLKLCAIFWLSMMFCELLESVVPNDPRSLTANCSNKRDVSISGFLLFSWIQNVFAICWKKNIIIRGGK